MLHRLVLRMKLRRGNKGSTRKRGEGSLRNLSRVLVISIAVKTEMNFAPTKNALSPLSEFLLVPSHTVRWNSGAHEG
jgi:hypothetical protein